MPKKRAQVRYSGMVQGVGFRWTAEHIANSLGLTGWVQNSPDGSVEVICEGREEDIETFLNEVKKEMGHYIKSSRVDWGGATGEFDRFSIKFIGA